MGSIANQREKAGGRQKYTVIATVVHLGDRGRLISVSSKSAWFTEWVPGQPGLFTEILSRKKRRGGDEMNSFESPAV